MKISFFLGFGDRSEIAYDTPKRCGTQIPVTVIISVKFMQSLCKVYAKFMQSLCKVYAKFMQERKILSPKISRESNIPYFSLACLAAEAEAVERS